MLVIEAAATIGGGTRTAALTLPGFVHDVCSAVHPFAVASPFFKTLPLAEHGSSWCNRLRPWPIRSTTAPSPCWSGRSTRPAARWAMTQPRIGD